MNYNFYDTPIEYLKGVGPKRAELLKKELKVYTFGDLLQYYPFRYIDRSRFFFISEINNDSLYIQLKGKISSVNLLGQGKTSRLVATLVDDTGSIDLVWFQGIKWVKDKIIKGEEYVVFGKPVLFNGFYNIPHPELEKLIDYQKEEEKEALYPFYYSTEKLKAIGLNSRGIAKIMKNLISLSKGLIYETLNDEIIEKFRFLSLEATLLNIHFPLSNELLKKSIYRIKFEELLFLQLSLIQSKKARIDKSVGIQFSKVGDIFNNFFRTKLPFSLTEAQKKVIREIRADLGSGKQMNRLLQGDVGSGKTLVALMSSMIAIDNGYQACIMVPTEILAYQHFNVIKKLIDDLPVDVQILTGSTKLSVRKKILSDLESGVLKILIGTHALIEDNVVFNNLGLVIIDEQHRFGVEQRARLWQKNHITPHILVMTATPIPRTLAMTLYGDLDVSIIDELPPGRKPVKTYHFYDSSRLKVFNFIKTQIKEGRQVYVVYPIINESETLDLKDLMDGYNSISREFPLPLYAISIVHGKMKPQDKEYEMLRFIKGETQIMVSTTVIEVGVDVPNATVMIIENAERFGLSQLHQLRGRVGRGAEQSFCILMTSTKLTNEGKKRIETMVRTNDGFEIAEADLKLRGPGDLQGTQQSGIIDLKLADIIKDEVLIKLSRDVAIEIINNDPYLESEKNRKLSEHLNFMKMKKGKWEKIS